jgi:hypothetical protein
VDKTILRYKKYFRGSPLPPDLRLSLSQPHKLEAEYYILVNAEGVTLIHLKDCENLCAKVEVALSLYVSLKPENLKANLPYLKGRYELVK